MSLPTFLPVARRYRLSPDLELPWPGAVVRAEMLEAARTASHWLDDARAAAARILQEAREQAEVVAHEAAGRAADEVWRDAAAVLEALRHQCELHERDAQALLVRLGQACLERLHVDLDAPWPSLSSARLLIEEWRSWRSAGRAQLWVHPGDRDELAQTLAHCTEIEIVAAPDLAAGDCALHCPAGELHASFQGSVGTLSTALASAAECQAAGLSLDTSER